MWPRVCEAILALWLLFSPAMLRHEPAGAAVVRGAAVVILSFSLLSFVHRFRRAHLFTLVTALTAACLPFLHRAPASPLMQNLLITALVTAMFAVIPSDATRPPQAWREMDSR